MVFFFFFKQKTAYEMRISDWSSDVCSSDLYRPRHRQRGERREREAPPDRIAAERRIGEPVKAETDRKHRQEQDNQWRHHRAIGAQRADHDDRRAEGQESPCREILNMPSYLQDRKITRLNSSQ